MLKKNAYELTNPQKNIWVTEQYYNNTNINNICGSAHINQELDFDKLQEAINIVIEKNDSFNIKFYIENNVLKQYLDEYKYYEVEIVDVVNEREVHRLEKEVCNKVFNIENENLFEFKIFRFPNNHGGYVMNIHHLLSDSWSHGLACKEVIRIYNNLINNITEEEKKYSYLDYISKEKEYLLSDSFLKDKEYWDNMYNTVPEVATIPSVKEKSQSQTNSLGKRKSINISEELTKKINKFCRDNKISIYNFLMTIYSIYISRVSNLDDFVIGTPILNRANFVDKHTTGMFISTVPLRIELKDSSSFIEFVKEIATRSMSMLRHQRYPYQNILEEIRKKDSNVPNLYNIVLSYQITKTVSEGIDYTTDWLFNGNCADDMQIHILDLNDSGSLNISYDFKAQKYKTQEIVDMHNRILCIIEQVLDNNKILVDDIEIVTDEEKNRILYEFNDTKVDFPRDKTIIDLFEEQVEKTPDNIAVVFENKKLTYRELNEKANSLANYLLDEGVERESVVGIRLDKSFEMIVGILAIMKIECTYLPINMSYPQDRVQYMLEDSKAKYLLTTNESIKEIDTEIKSIAIDLNKEKIYSKNNKNFKRNINQESIIYIIYTSGSTGKPKGAAICHRNVVRLFINDKMLYDFNEKDVWTMFHSVAFDFSVWEMYGALLFGGKLVLVPDNIAKDTNLFLDLLRKENVTVLNQTPTYFYNLLSLENERKDKELKIRYIIFGGEALKPKLIRNWKIKYPNTKLINMYGITETTVHVTFKELTEEDLKSNVSNIGVPIPTLQVLILDKKLNLLPYGVPGEMCVLGDGVFKGYLNREDLNKQKLVKSKFYDSILYRSGDNAILHRDGMLEYLGRIDKQVKIRGFRVELGEIEEEILKNIDINRCIVTKKTDKNDRDILCAYYISDKDINIKNIKQNIQKNLPYYMVPQYFIKIDRIPININGKTDFKVLPLPKEVENKKEVIKERNNIDKIIIKAFKKFLNIENVSIEESFFDLGGDSLSAISICSYINKMLDTKITVRDILENPTIIELSDFIIMNKNNKDVNFKIACSNQQDKYPLSSAQKRIYYASKMAGEDKLLYNVPGALLISKKLDKEKVEKVFNKIIKRHSVFRTKFILEDGEVYQKIYETSKINVNIYNNTKKEIKKIVNEFPKPFNLEKDILLRIELHYIDNEKTLLLLDSHHIIMDGTSLSILVDEFVKLYNEVTIEDIKIEYKDYAVWENNFINSEEIKSLEKYWLNKFKETDFNSLNLPYDYSVPANRNYNGNRISKKLDKVKFNKLKQYAKKIGVSPYMLFLSAFYILLYKYTGQTELTLGSPVVNREIYETKNIIGMFVNNIVTKAQIDSNKKFTDFVQEMKEQVLNDLENQAYPYDLLVKKLNIPVDNSKNPLFDVMFIYQNTENDKIIFDREEVKQIVADSNIAKFNLSLEIEPNKNNINLEYATSLFKKETIERLYEHYINVLDYILSNKDTLIKDIDILSEAEKNKILYEFNNTKTEYPKDKTIIQLFEEQVEKIPNNIAVVFEEQKLTYTELNEKANQLAHYLKRENLSQEDIICILLDKSLEMIIAILAILKNGCAYLPIDITYPKERIDYILKDSRAKILLTSRQLINNSNSDIKSICIDIDTPNIYEESIKTNLDIIGKNNDLAYIMYTSGSTGNPKGVMIENKNVVRLVKNTNYIEFKKNDRILQTGSIVFDACTFEIWGALLNGLELYIIRKEELLDATMIKKYIEKNKITVLWLTAPLFNQICEQDPETFRKVRCLLTGGDVLSPKHINKVRNTNPNLQVINGYGPTENTTFSCCYTIEKDFKKSVPIGSPIANSTCYIVSENGMLQPIGIPGELWVGGDGVGRGYFNNPKLTQEKFIKSPFDNGKVYKTGDLVKWRNDGTIDFLGRIDNQVKVRGFRVELSEISVAITKYEGMKEAFTIYEEINKKKAICSYIVSKEKVDIDKLKLFLKETLPQYMIPEYFMQIEKLPINQNGKVNKNLLPKDFIKQEVKKEIKLPVSETEKNIYDILKKVLDYDNLSIDDNFFNIGGDSLLAMKLQIEALNKGMNITYADIFNYPSVVSLAKFLETKIKLPKTGMPGYEPLLYKYDDILLKNSIEELEKTELSKTPIGNVLLTGVTGFLGAHVLDSFIKKETGIIYCLIRRKNNMSAEERLENTLHFYFNDKYDMYLGNRIRFVEGDITLNNFGLTPKQYKELGEDLNTVIHSAALVKHFGSYESFENINIKGTKRVVDYCKNFDLKLLHISTISVSGNNFAEGSYVENTFKEEINYDETKFYIGQNVDNVYTKSKFLAEKLVLDGIQDGLKAYILRMGNLTSRFSEGKFQQNHFENAFVNRFKSLLQIGCIPDYLLKLYTEFTPIDYCGDAIINLGNYYHDKFTVFHLLNDNHLQIPKLLEILQELGIKSEAVSSEKFKEIINKLLTSKENSDILNGIISDLTQNKELIYESNIKIISEFTKQFLKKTGFEWPQIDKRYIKNYFKYLIEIGYLNLKIKED